MAGDPADLEPQPDYPDWLVRQVEQGFEASLPRLRAIICGRLAYGFHRWLLRNECLLYGDDDPRLASFRDEQLARYIAEQIPDMLNEL